MSHRILSNGDLVALEVDRMGFAASPPMLEPVAEHAETVSQLRIARYR